VAFLTAQTGTDGVRLARERRPVLVLLDLRLPDIHGLEVLDRLRAEPDTAELDVAIVTGGGLGGETLERLQRAGVRDVIGKPFPVERLLAVVDAALDRSDSAP
jgi:DNA-binding response OmpR family regulator